MKKVALSVMLALAGVAAAHADPIPKESGFSGYGLLGGSYTDVKSNTVIGPKSDDSKRISSLGDTASSKGYGVDANLDLRYTFADIRTQLYFGNLIQDAVMMDFSRQFGIRTEVADKGIVSLGYLFSGLSGTYGDVWSNPYETGTARSETSRDAKGFRLGWENIWGSRLVANYSHRQIDIDNEQSGAGLGLSSAELASLNRNGRNDAFDVGYNFVSPTGSVLTPTLQYSRNNADGDAMSYKRYGAQVTYAMMQPKYSLVTSAFWAHVKYDAENPVFGDTVKADVWGLNANLFWHRLWNIDKLSAVFSGGYGRYDANVGFFDSEMSRVSAGLMYSF